MTLDAIIQYYYIILKAVQYNGVKTCRMSVNIVFDGDPYDEGEDDGGG